MDTFASAIKNQHSFNKMLESQLAQLAAVVPPLEKGKIRGQPDDLENETLLIFTMQPNILLSQQMYSGLTTLYQRRWDTLEDLSFLSL